MENFEIVQYDPNTIGKIISHNVTQSSVGHIWIAPPLVVIEKTSGILVGTPSVLEYYKSPFMKLGNYTDDSLGSMVKFLLGALKQGFVMDLYKNHGPSLSKAFVFRVLSTTRLRKVNLYTLEEEYHAMIIGQKAQKKLNIEQEVRSIARENSMLFQSVNRIRVAYMKYVGRAQTTQDDLEIISALCAVFSQKLRIVDEKTTSQPSLQLVIQVLRSISFEPDVFEEIGDIYATMPIGSNTPNALLENAYHAFKNMPDDDYYFLSDEEDDDE